MINATTHASTAPAQAGDLMLIPGPARAYPAAARAFRIAYNGKRNFLTPDLIGYQHAGPWVCEVSRGDGFRNRDGSAGPAIYAVTVVDLETCAPVYALSSVVIDRNAASLYIGRLADLAQYRKARRKVLADLAHIRAIAETEEMARRLVVDRLYAAAAMRESFARVLTRFGAEAHEEEAPVCGADQPTLGDVIYALAPRN